MARKRMLSPDFFTSLPVNSLPIEAMVTFAGLWVYVDDYGHGEDDVDLIKSTVWPRRRSITVAKVASHLEKIAAAGLICRYEVAGYRLLHSPSWTEHQTVSHPTPPKLPPCPTHEQEAFDEFLSASDPARERFRSRLGGMSE